MVARPPTNVTASTLAYYKSICSQNTHGTRSRDQVTSLEREVKENKISVSKTGVVTHPPNIVYYYQDSGYSIVDNLSYPQLL